MAIRHGRSIELGRLKIDKDLLLKRFIRVQFESCLLCKNKEVLPSTSVYTNKNNIFLKKRLYKLMELIVL